MLTNQEGGACRCICFLLLLGLCYGLDHWSLRGSTYQSHGNFEIDRENLKVIVTATNTMYHLDLELGTKSNVIQVGPEQSAAEACDDDFRPDEECQNYPRVLVLPGGAWPIMADDGTVWNTSDTVLSCGSNAFSPRCYYRSRSDLQLLTSSSSSHFNPFGPSSWVPGIWMSTGRLIVATPQDALFTKFGITMSEVPFNGAVQATTRVNQRLWFNKTPNFVSMYEIGEYLYVFFREEAVEVEQRVIYSRVARICKDDTGSSHEGTTIFTTYIKARISCNSRPNARVRSVVYHYNDLYATYYQPEEQRLYAVFRSPLNGPLGSVVCSYTFGANRNDLETVFSGDYLVEQATNRFIKQRNFDPFTCSEGRTLEDANSVQLMATMATQATTNPTLMMEGLAFQGIVSDRIDSEQEVLFITAYRESDSALVLLKVLVTTVDDNDPSYYVIRTTVLPTTALDPDSTPRVIKMEMYGSGSSAYVYIGTEADIYRVPVQDCATTYTTCCQCVAARDPYCAFNPTSGPSGSCVPLASPDTPQGLLQDLTDGDIDVCVITASSSISETQPSGRNSDPTTSQPVVVKVCSGGDTAGGTIGGDGGANVVDTTDNTGPGTVSESGVKGKQDGIQGYQAWIIVGTVGGFIGGVVLGMLVVIIYKHFGIGRRNKTIDLIRPRAITNDTNVSPGRNKKVGVAPGGQSKEEVRINNSTSEFSNSNNFTRSSNDYTRHVPHLKEPQTPVKYPMTPEEEAAAAKKCVATPPPEFSLPPSKSQPSVFTFTPSSVPPHSCSTPKSPPYCSSVAGASSSSDGSYQEPGGGGGDKLSHTDPNVQLNYKARVYLTNSQREAYGRNILARMPSIDGSKSKYTGIVELPGRVSSSTMVAGSPMYAGDSLPRQVGYHRRQDIVQLDTELGCSQC